MEVTNEQMLRMRTPPGADRESMLHVANRRKEYDTGDDTVCAVNGVSFTDDRGEVVGLLGLTLARPRSSGTVWVS